MELRGRTVNPGVAEGEAIVTQTPFSFAETYEERANPDPVFGEHFAIGDVPAGVYVLGAEVDGAKVWRTVRVEAGRVTDVEFQQRYAGE